MASQPLIYALSKIIIIIVTTHNITTVIWRSLWVTNQYSYSFLTLPLQYVCIFNSRFAIGSGLHPFIGIGAGPREPRGGRGRQVSKWRGSMNERSSYVTRSRVESLRRASRHRSWSSAVSSSGVRSDQLFSRIFISSLLCFLNQLFGRVYSLF